MPVPGPPDGSTIVAPAIVGGGEGIYAIPADGSGTLSRIINREWVEPDWVGSAGAVASSCPEDVYVDGLIDIVDVQMVAGGWGGADPTLDVDGDGDVDLDDVQQVASMWGDSCP